MQKLIKPLNAPVRLEHSPLPEPSAELATVRIAIVGLCRTDLLVATGKLPVRTDVVVGHECAGHVVHDPSGRFEPGVPVALNPLLPDGRFLGLDCDGALQEVVQVHPDQLIAAEDISLQLAAYVEPVAASMAVLKARLPVPPARGVIYHANRISHLTHLVMTSTGLNVDWIPHPPDGSVHNHYDFAVETLFEEDAINATLNALKPGGLLVVKSRQHGKRAIVPAMLVAKELTLQAVNYYDFRNAMRWLKGHPDLVAPLLGDTYPLRDWQQAFAAAEAGDAKKIFIAL
jgi:L-iditol 2-dehydrogenase